jgi:hypothetical protein
MPDDLRARIATALRDHDRNMDGGDPAHDADDGYGCCAEAVMAVVQPELDRVPRCGATTPSVFNNAPPLGPCILNHSHGGMHEESGPPGFPFSPGARWIEHDDAADGAALRDLMVAAEQLALDWPNPGTPAHRQAVTLAVSAAEKRFADLLNGAAGCRPSNNPEQSRDQQ